MRAAFLWFIILAAAAMPLCGCMGGRIYDAAAPRAPASAISERHSWEISGNLSDPARAIDGYVETAAVAENGGGAAQLTVDLGKPGLFNMVIVDHGGEEFGFPKRMALETSLDGQNFTPRYEVLGTRRVTLLVLPAPVLARYVRLRASEPGSRPWAVAEIYLQ